MCGLFGFTIYGDNKKQYNKLINALGNYASERGTHATGISYNKTGKCIIYKKPLPAYKMNLKHFENVKAVMGHTRHATQGLAKNNENNHPFKGTVKDCTFSLAHNGVIYNDKEIRKKYNIKKPKIDTDSYILVDMLEKTDELNFNTIAKSLEELQGYFTFTILDDRDNLYIAKGDSPISIVHLKKLEMFVYGSTDEILYKALIDADLFDEILKGNYEQINIEDDEIIRINNDGTIDRGNYEPNYSYYSSYYMKKWYEYDFNKTDKTGDTDDDYYEELVSVAKYLGYEKTDIDNLINDGFTLDEVEEYIYGY